MTREEAKRYMELYKLRLTGSVNSSELVDDIKAFDMAIEALEQEPCNVLEKLEQIRAEIEGYKLTIDRAISEDELKIEGMKKAYANCIDIIDKYKAESEGLKGEQEPKTEWIPVSEKIPIIETDVLLTSWSGKAEYVGWIDAFGKWHEDEEEVIDGYEPLAWMPLPKPYQESEEFSDYPGMPDQFDNMTGSMNL